VSVPPVAGPPPWRTPRLLAGLLLLAALGGCGPRPGWRVQRLADPGLPTRTPEELERCRRRLALAPERPAPAYATNFGERRRRDSFGRPVPARPALIVLHETVLPAEDTLRFFATPHPRDEDQASYHMLVDRSGARLRIVPDERRAYGAGMSAFGDFSVRIRPTSVGSINNVALHLSLESPPDGRGDAPAHAGYSDAQYAAAAAQVLLWQARHGIPMSRVTTHAAVDRSHSRYDPRAFRWNRFDAAYRRAAERCELGGYDNGRATP
jgi:N-acetyl-anhydromuramyl-L-alanine amidase AmpD